MGTGRKKIEVKKIEKDSRRMVTFSKRRKGLFKKATELHSITGSDIAILVFSQTGRLYTHGDPCFEPTIDRYLNSVQENIKNDDEIEDGDQINMWKTWVDSINVEGFDNVEELGLLKNSLEDIKWKDWCYGVLKIQSDGNDNVEELGFLKNNLEEIK